MIRPALLLGLALAFAAPALAQDRGGGGDRGAPRGSYANPTAAIAAEIAFAQLAIEKGQWTAFRETAAPDAVIFTPAMTLAQPWLKGRANPPTLLRWQPHQVWSSCDGSVMVTTGAWQKGDGHGWFTTVWQRQSDGRYRWVFDHGASLEEPLAAPDMIAAKIADCQARSTSRTTAGPPPGARGRRPQRPAKAPPVPFDPTARQGRSDDGTLTWQVSADAAGTHDFSARLQTDAEMREFRKEHVSASGS